MGRIWTPECNFQPLLLDAPAVNIQAWGEHSTDFARSYTPIRVRLTLGEEW